MWKTVVACYSQLHSSAHLDTKIGTVMKKVLGKTSKRKKIFLEAAVFPTAEMFSRGSTEGKYSKNARRVSVLNKLFMKHITDLIATGEYSSEFSGLGVVINRVQVSPDFSGVNVFWVAKDNEHDDVTDKVLKKNAGFLRHELSSLRVIGNVPRINFVKDKQCSQIMELDARLAKADFGEEHIPVEMETKLKTQLELYTQLPTAVKEKVQEVDAEPAEEYTEEILPLMPQNVLGLDHAEILKKIKKNLKKAQAPHRTEETDSELVHSVNENPINLGSNMERKEAFRKFLEKREALKSRMRKLDKNYYPDVEYMKQEIEERRSEYFKNMDSFEEEEDYVEDDEKQN